MRRLPRHPPLILASIVMLAAAGVSCSLLVDTSGLAGAPIAADAATADGDGDAGAQDAVVSAESSMNDGPQPSTYAATVLTDSPIAYFPLDEPAGATSIKSILGSVTGTFTKGVALGTASPIGDAGKTAATFSLAPGGEDSDLQLGEHFGFIGTNAFTVEAWINPQIDANVRHVVSKADRNVSPLDGWNVCVALAPGPVVWIERIPGTFSAFKRSPQVTITPNVFSHVAAVYDGANLFIYVNGVASASVAQAGAITATTTAAFLGSANGGSPQGHGYIGVIDEVAIYDKVLPAARVAAHFAAGRP